jgi:hypothetical protein
VIGQVRFWRRQVHSADQAHHVQNGRPARRSRQPQSPGASCRAGRRPTRRWHPRRWSVDISARGAASSLGPRTP